MIEIRSQKLPQGERGKKIVHVESGSRHLNINTEVQSAIKQCSKIFEEKFQPRILYLIKLSIEYHEVDKCSDMQQLKFTSHASLCSIQVFNKSHILEDNLFYSESTNLNGNLIQKNPHRNIQNNVAQRHQHIKLTIIVSKKNFYLLYLTIWKTILIDKNMWKKW